VAEEEQADSRKRLIKRLIPAGIAVLVLLSLPAIASLYVELRWFRSVGYEQIFTTMLWTKIALGIVIGLLYGAVLASNLYLVLKLTKGLTGIVLSDPTGQTRIEVGNIVARFIWPVAGLVALLSGLSGSQQWQTWLRYVHASSFGVADPIFGNDISFYVFELPALEAISGGLSTVIGMSLFFSAVLYGARGGLTFGPGGLEADKRARGHLLGLAAAMLVLFAFDAWLARFSLLYSTLGPVQGASYADVQARLPMLNGLIVISLISAGLVAAAATRKRLVLAIAGIGLYAAGQILGVQVYPSLVHRFSVLPNEAVKEAPYISHNIEATRAGFGLANVTERELTGELQLSHADILHNRATIENVRLWDHQPLLDTFAQIQEIRTYYEFASVDNDRYMVDGSLRQTMLSPRELDAESLPNRTWINEHFTFTHGYGITLGPVNVATNEGLPELLLYDIPPQTQLENLEVDRPEIYFGERSNEYVFVRTETRAFDYPQGEDNVYAEYEGSAGIHLDSTVTRAAMALRLGSFKILLTDDLRDDSRILLHRNIRDRVGTLAPFLHFDADPYMVLRDDGSLSWIQDAYTTSSRYPYSQTHPAYGGVNYIRNSVKIVIDAFNGTVDLYNADDEDPILRTWRRIFPGAFKPLAEMPEDLRSHLRYPEDIFRVQTESFVVYHMDSPELIYNREDQWEIPTIRVQDQLTQMVPYYTIMRLPEEEDEEFIQMLPFTPASKENLAAWMVARSDGAHRGELVVYTFPKDRLIFGPGQVMNRINQNADISRQLSLWDQRGSEVNLGTLLVIPIEESLIYVCPLYLRSSGGQIPELKRVIVAYESSIAMEETLDAALASLFGERVAAIVEAPPITDTGTGTETETGTGTETETGTGTGTETGAVVVAGSVGERARQHYERAVAAQREGDWAAYGAALEELEAALQELAPRTGD